MMGLLIVAATASTGCTQRTITITSNPPGALVHLNDQEVGRTPVTVPFTWYGTYDVRLEAEGHQVLWTQQEARPPLWDLPGPDLIAEAIPGSRVDLKWHFELQPKAQMDTANVVDRARQMRALVREGAE